MCDDPRVMRAIASQTKNWVDLYEAADFARVHRLLETHDEASVLVTQLLLSREEGIAGLADLRHRRPRTRRCLLASYSDLRKVVDVIHDGLIDALVHVPLMKGQFLSAVSGPSLASMMPVGAGAVAFAA
jgi:DNA-binding NtrC family response regulator